MATIQPAEDPGSVVQPTGICPPGGKLSSGAANVAVTLFALLSVNRHEATVPAQSPDQPTKAVPAPGVAVRVTVLPEATYSQQVSPQLMPAGLLVTVPVPLPTVFTFSNICNVPAGRTAESIHAASAPSNRLPSLA